MTSSNTSFGSKLLVFEGPDAVGKSTVVAEIVQKLLAQNIPTVSLSFPGRQAGTLGHLVYKIHHDSGSLGVEAVDPNALQALHIAAHLDAIERVIKPLLASGKTVVLDRYWWSTWVYGNVAGMASMVLQHLVEAEKAVWGSCLPAHVFLLDRELPLRPDGTQNWLELKSTYADLSEQEKSFYPVHVIANEGPLSETIEKIWFEIAGNSSY